MNPVGAVFWVVTYLLLFDQTGCVKLSDQEMTQFESSQKYLTEEQARALNPETGKYDYTHGLENENHVDIQVVGRNGITIGCYGTVAAQTTYYTDKNGQHNSILDLDTPIDMQQSDGKIIQIAIHDVLPRCLPRLIQQTLEPRESIVDYVSVQAPGGNLLKGKVYPHGGEKVSTNTFTTTVEREKPPRPATNTPPVTTSSTTSAPPEVISITETGKITTLFREPKHPIDVVPNPTSHRTVVTILPPSTGPETGTTLTGTIVIPELPSISNTLSLSKTPSFHNTLSIPDTLPFAKTSSFHNTLSFSKTSSFPNTPSIPTPPPWSQKTPPSIPNHLDRPNLPFEVYSPPVISVPTPSTEPRTRVDTWTVPINTPIVRTPPTFFSNPPATPVRIPGQELTTSQPPPCARDHQTEFAAPPPVLVKKEPHVETAAPPPVFVKKEPHVETAVPPPVFVKKEPHVETAAPPPVFVKKEPHVETAVPPPVFVKKEPHVEITPPLLVTPGNREPHTESTTTKEIVVNIPPIASHIGSTPPTHPTQRVVVTKPTAHPSLHTTHVTTPTTPKATTHKTTPSPLNYGKTPLPFHEVSKQCVPDVVLFTKQISDEYTDPFPVSFEHCTCTCPNVKRVPTAYLQGINRGGS